MYRLKRLKIQKRYFLFAFVSIVLGILGVYAFLFAKYELGCVVAFLFVGFCTLIARSNIKWLIICGAFCVVGCLGFVFSIIEYNGYEKYCAEDVVIEARITDRLNQSAEYGSVIIENCKLKIGEEEWFVGEILLKYSSTDLGSGAIIKFTSKVTKIPLLNYESINNSYITKDIFLQTTLYSLSSVISYEEGSLTWDENFRQSVKSNIENFITDSESAQLCFAIMFGDKYELSDSLSDSFRKSGIAHILAVSGLHVAILFGLVIFLLNLIKINRIYKFFLASLFILLFAYLCNFSPSVVRAGIMCIVCGYSFVYHNKIDILNSLSISGIVILLANPLAVFDISFALSFTCLFGMIALVPIISKMFGVYANNKFLKLVSVTISIQIATLPLMAYYFGYFSIVGLLANVILLPFFSIVYPVLVVSMIFAPVGGLFAFFGSILTLLFGYFIAIAKFFASIDYATIYILKNTVASLVLCIALLFLVSRFVILKPKLKTILVGLFVIVIALSNVFGTGMYAKENQIFALSEGKDSCAITVGYNSITILNPFGQSYEITEWKKFLNSVNYNEVKTLIVTENKVYNYEYMKEFLEKYNITTIYCREFLEENLVEKFDEFDIDCSIICLQNLHSYDIGRTMKYIELNDESYAVTFALDNYDFAFMNSQDLMIGDIELFEFLNGSDFEVVKIDNLLDYSELSQDKIGIGNGYLYSNGEFQYTDASNYIFKFE